MSVCASVYLVLCRTQRQCDLRQLGADLRGNSGMEVFVFHLLAISNLLQSLPLTPNTAMGCLEDTRYHGYTKKSTFLSLKPLMSTTNNG